MSTKTKKKLTLPKGLSRLPRVPKGYSHWEYAGMGKKNSRQFIGVLTSFLSENGKWSTPMDAWLGNSEDCHYIRAIKRPAPAKKQPKAKAVKAVTAYANTDLTELSTDWAVIAEGHNAPKCDPVTVAVLDISNPDALVEQAANAIAEYNTAPGKEVMRVACDAAIAKLVIESLGIIPKRKGAK